MSRTHPRVAIASVGLGRVQRGFERYFSDLFSVARHDIDLVLFRSAASTTATEKVPPFLQAVTAIVRRLPIARWVGTSEYGRDCLAFALCLLPSMVFGRFDVIHCVDPPLVKVLVRLKKLLRFRVKILFTEGTLMPPEAYPDVDHIHHVQLGQFQRALAAGVPAETMTMVPAGVDDATFRPYDDRGRLRELYGIGSDTFVILVVSAIKREHKRVDHLVAEAATLPDDVLLWIDGNPEDPELVAQARATLGKRLRITHVPSTRVAELYRLADVLVHASLAESFGLVLVEAICSGLPVLAHDTPHFEWVTGDRACLVDMNTPGALANRLIAVRAAGAEARESAVRRAEDARVRFGWSTLKESYVAMYRDVAHTAEMMR